MALRLRNSATFTMNADGRLSYADPRTGKSNILTPEILDLLGFVARAEPLEDWAKKYRVNSQTLDICLSSLKSLGLIAQNGEQSPAPASKQPRPAFIISAMRSGSTLLRYLLDAHENIACPPESKFIAGLQSFLDFPDTYTALNTLGMDLDSIYGTLRAFSVEIFDSYARQQNKHRWIDKTPQYYRHLDLIEALFQQDAQYLCLVRHPLDTVLSLEDMWRGHGGMERHDDLTLCVKTYGKGRLAYAHYWNQVNEVILSFSRAHPTRCHLVRYEDLVTSPQTVLKDVFHFLGEPDDPGVIERAFSTDHTPGYQDHKITQTKSILTTSVDQWKTWPTSDIAALAPVVENLALQFRYAPLTSQS